MVVVLCWHHDRYLTIFIATSRCRHDLAVLFLSNIVELSCLQHYHTELSANNRAGCQDKVCKDNAEKITKGQLRCGTWVEIQEHGSWRWKHWYVVNLFVVPPHREGQSA